MSVHIKPIHQIQRVNKLKNLLDELRNKDTQSFMIRPHEKAWCGAEVLKHMIIAQDVYSQKINGTLSKLKTITTDLESVRAKGIPSFLIKRFPPIEGQIRFKMKTQKRHSRTNSSAIYKSIIRKRVDTNN